MWKERTIAALEDCPGDLGYWFICCSGSVVVGVVSELIVNDMLDVNK